MDLGKLFDLTGRVAVITGGTRGIGRALAEGFGAAGAAVVVASRKADACAETEEALRAAGVDALGVPTHMGDLDAVAALVDATVERFGRLDIVVNNAANALQMPLKDLTPDAWDKSYNPNLKGPVFLAKAAYPHLVASPHAAILNVISVGAITWSPGTAMYAGAKILIADIDDSRAESLADELPEALGIAVDVTSAADLERARDTAIDRWGRVDIVMNNVGVLAVGEPEAIPVEAWHSILDINFL